MPTLKIAFAGWFQCRLPTNPDPTDEPRGVSGYTFAVAGEDDFDRIIRFNDARFPRSHAPEVKVRVQAVSLDGRPLDHHPLLQAGGARVDLLDDARFEAANYILVDEGSEPIDPFHLQVRGEGVSLRRRFLWDPERPGLELGDLDREALKGQGGVFASAEGRIEATTGIDDPIAWRTRRQALLRADLARARTPVERAALTTRLRELDFSLEPRNHADRRNQSLFAIEERSFALNSPAPEVVDPQSALGRIDVSRPWPIAFWMGAWDADGLVGYLDGTLEIPLSEG